MKLTDMPKVRYFTMARNWFKRLHDLDAESRLAHSKVFRDENDAALVGDRIAGMKMHHLDPLLGR